MNRPLTLSEYISASYPIIPETNFFDNMKDDVEPLLKKLRQTQYFSRPDAFSLYSEYFLLPEAETGKTRGTIFISHGFSESCDKYHEVIYYMLREHYNVVLIEHRGHGRSRRPGESNFANTPIHTECFQDYVDDMHCVVQEVLCKKMPAPYYLYAHSMGGAIAATYLEQHTDIFEKAVFTAPMFEINRLGIPKFLAKFIGFWNCLTGKAEKFTIGQKPFCPVPDFANSPCTSEKRYLYYFQQQLETPEYQGAGSSNRWARESLRACDKLLKTENCQKITIPVLLFQADQDTFVYPGGQNHFIDRIPHGNLIFVPGSRHEIYMSEDQTLARYWAAIFRFLASQNTPAH